MGRTTHAWVLGLGLGALGGVVSCEDEGDGNVACYYQQRLSECGGGGFGAWEDRCTTIENGKPCTEVAMNHTNCEASCCIQFQARNHMEVSGSCEDTEPPEGDDDDDDDGDEGGSEGPIDDNDSAEGGTALPGDAESGGDDDDDDSYGGGVTTLDPRMTIEPPADAD